MKRKDFVEKQTTDIAEQTAQAIVRYHTKVEIERLEKVFKELENATWRTLDKLTITQLAKAIAIAATVDYKNDRGAEHTLYENGEIPS